MAGLSLSSVRDAFSVLLPIRTEGERPPLFCMHPAGGLSWCYMPLARYVSDHFRLYGLQARGLDGKTELADSVREMAPDYIEQIRTVQPSGPYYLLGGSFGGTVAHETAVQLQAQGEEVAALIIADNFPSASGSYLPTERRVRRAGGDSEVRIASQEGDKPSRGIIDLEADSASLIEFVRAEAGEVLGAITDDEVKLLAKAFAKNARLMREHDYGRFDGNALVFVAAAGKEISTAEQGGGNSPAARWRPYISSEVSEVHLPCTHTEIFRPDMLAQVWAGTSSWLGLQ